MAPSSNAVRQCLARPVLQAAAAFPVSRAEIALTALLLAGIAVTSRYNYLLFHSLVELFSIVVAFSFGLVALGSRWAVRDQYLAFVGMAYLFVGGLDTLHMLSFTGMQIFRDYDYYAPQFWIAARVTEAGSFFMSLLLMRLKSRFNMTLAFVALSLLSGLLCASILVFRIFPACFIPGVGLTPFKIYAEYAIVLVLIVDMVLLRNRRSLLNHTVYLLLQGSLFLMIGMELCFTQYLSDRMSDLPNMVGHLAKVAAFLLIFKAVVLTAIREPMEILFRDLQASHEALRLAKEAAEQGFRNEQLLLGAIVQSSDDAIFSFDRLGMIMNWNRGAERLFGYAADVAVRRGIDMLVPPKGRVQWLDWMHRVQQGQAIGSQDTVLLRSDGQAVDVSVSLSPLPSHDGTLLGGSIIVRNTSRQRAAERAIARDRTRLETILRTSSDGIHILDQNGLLIEANDAFLAMLGYDKSWIGRLHVGAWDVKLSWPEIRQRNEALIQTRGHQVFETVHRRIDGRQIDVEISATGIEIEGCGYLYAASRDITQRRRLEIAQSIAAVAFESDLGMAVTNSDGVILRTNRAYSVITGYSSEELIGSTFDLLKVSEASSGHRGITYSLRSLGVWQGEWQGQRKSGERFPQALTITAVREAPGIASHYVVTVSDITRQKAAEDEIRNLAFFDPLTGLPNRRLLMDRLRKISTQIARQRSHIALLFIDLDHFKYLNDTAGHVKGDLLLRQVATLIRENVRPIDTVTRLGGDEFIVMMPELSEDPLEAANQARAVAENLRGTLCRAYVLDTLSHHLSASIGITLLDRDHEAFEEPLKRADLAMYEAKNAGRNTIRFFDPQMQAVVSARAALELDFRQALAQGAFELYYQPQVCTDGRVFGTEALIRWNHPTRGLVMPGGFIALAEETGLILPMGRWVIEAACRQLVAWAQQVLTNELSIAINVSARQFHEAGFVDEVLEVLQRSGANPALLKLELTESLILQDLPAVIAKMHQLKTHGIGLSLDDFGTGYSSLGALKSLPIDQLKIDHSFVRGILSDATDAALSRIVIQLAQTLRLTAVAEGVETAEQQAFLIGQGCEVFQGYLFSRPKPAADVEAMLRRTAVGTVLA